MTEFESMTESVIKRLLKPLEAKIAELEADLTLMEEAVRGLSTSVKNLEVPSGPNTGTWWQHQFVYPESLQTPTCQARPDAVVEGQSVTVTDVKMIFK